MFYFRYFVNKKNGYIPSSLDDDVMTHMEQSAKYIMACNGWVMGDNPLKNFALPGKISQRLIHCFNFTTSILPSYLLLSNI